MADIDARLASRILDMPRTVTNVGSDLVTTAVVDAGQRRQYGGQGPTA